MHARISTMDRLGRWRSIRCMLTLITGATGKTGSRIIDRLTAADRRRPGRLPRHRLRLGGPLDVARRARRRRRRVHRLLPRPRAARRGGDRRRVRPRGAPPRACSGSCCCRAAASPRPCAPSARSSPRAWPLTVVRCSWFAQNFSESFMARRRPARRGRAARRRHAGAVRRRRGHRRRRVRRADRGRPRGRGLRAHRPARAAHRRGRGGDRRRDRARRCASRGITPEAYREAVPPELADFVVFLFTELLDGRNAEPQDGVPPRARPRPARLRRVRPPRAAAGAWA